MLTFAISFRNVKRTADESEAGVVPLGRRISVCRVDLPIEEFSFHTGEVGTANQRVQDRGLSFTEALIVMWVHSFNEVKEDDPEVTHKESRTR